MREPRPEHAAPPQPGPAADLLALQRSAGNAAVAKLLRKEPTPEPPRPGGWNEDGRGVAGTQRIPVNGVKAGNRVATSSRGAGGRRRESDRHRAQRRRPGRAPEVLLFFHGMGNLGYRERRRPTRRAARGHRARRRDRPYPAAARAQRPQHRRHPPAGHQHGAVRHRRPAGVRHRGRRAAAACAGITLPNAITPGRIVVSGHSGGGGRRRGGQGADRPRRRRPTTSG